MIVEIEDAFADTIRKSPINIRIDKNAIISAKDNGEFTQIIGRSTFYKIVGAKFLRPIVRTELGPLQVTVDEYPGRYTITLSY